MSVAIITGSAGLVGSEAVVYFSKLGLDIVGIDNGMRADFFWPRSFHPLGSRSSSQSSPWLRSSRRRHPQF
jgi:nucleoside-diphosphate-sugar epimerase